MWRPPCGTVVRQALCSVWKTAVLHRGHQSITLDRRSMGVHLSKVRSANLDTWLPEQVAFVAAMGNGRAAVFWEARLPANFERPRDGDMRALSVFINQKCAHVMLALCCVLCHALV